MALDVSDYLSRALLQLSEQRADAQRNILNAEQALVKNRQQLANIQVQIQLVEEAKAIEDGDAHVTPEYVSPALAVTQSDLVTRINRPRAMDLEEEVEERPKRAPRSKSLADVALATMSTPHIGEYE